MVRTGIIGVGKMGISHLAILGAHPEVSTPGELPAFPTSCIAALSALLAAIAAMLAVRRTARILETKLLIGEAMLRRGVTPVFRQVALPDAFLDAGALPTLADRYGVSSEALAVESGIAARRRPTRSRKRSAS